jgi:PAS domain S-box-containing protein
VLHISTTFVDIEDKVHGLDSGADGYLTSLAEPMEMIATIRALLRIRRAEDAAHLSASQWQATFDAISDGVMLLDGSGKVVQANRTLERILGGPWTEIVGKVPSELLGDAYAADDSLFARMLASREREATDLAFGDLWLHVAVDPLRDRLGSIRGAICLVTDITDRKRMEMELLHQAEELQQASQRKDEFLAQSARSPGKHAADHSLTDAREYADRRIARCRAASDPAHVAPARRFARRIANHAWPH